MKLVTLKKRAEFLRLRGGARCSTPPFVLETRARLDDVAGTNGPRFGFTVTKAIGNAVLRNRIRRRLKAAVTAVATDNARASHDYVLIARGDAATRDFAVLKKDLEHAFHRVHLPTSTSSPRREPRKGQRP
ncbi:MAG: ribonuclease P protein component [Hyphomicrobium sp.]|nr:ribonuclease P protein component [Hyphomicrobium sp.]